MSDLKVDTHGVLLTSPTGPERKLVAQLLRRGSDELSHRSCNDFDLVRQGGLTPEEAFKVRQEMHVWFDDKLADPPKPQDRPIEPDYWLMKMLADKLDPKPERR